ncbi:hypothetical protein V1460_18610 [Streptomyces sp. SCSIO 30461]|uniref:hypothetical protein n=1 Tax=Streptomyces sp. SCSIO 30461 TaxID=3118085 RepID=UPI0030CF588B
MTISCGETVTLLGFAYRYLPVPDCRMPAPRIADALVALACAPPSGGRLRIHCREGRGRTTTFMAMCDMTKNARQVRLDGILRRRYLLAGAGTDLAADSSRVPVLRSIYDRARHNDDGFRSTFTQWPAAHPHPTEDYPLMMLPPRRSGSK